MEKLVPDRTTHEHLPQLCHRCGKTLTPGRGDFYVVHIEALADPSPPDLDREEFAEWTNEDFHRALEHIVEEVGGLSEQELARQVYHRLTIYLCGSCYAEWIEDPAA